MRRTLAPEGMEPLSAPHPHPRRSAPSPFPAPAVELRSIMVLRCPTPSSPSPAARPRRLVALTIAAGLAWSAGLGWSGPVLAFGPTLDSIFRDSLRGDNDGILPPYVLNRGLIPVPHRKPPTPEEAAELARERGGSIVGLDLTPALTWAEVLAEVARGEPTPLAVEAVRQRADSDDGPATELLAWMHVNGVGVRRDLVRAFNLYARAADLGIEAAQINAAAVFRSLSVDQRAQVHNPFN